MDDLASCSSRVATNSPLDYFQQDLIHGGTQGEEMVLPDLHEKVQDRSERSMVLVAE